MGRTWPGRIGCSTAHAEHRIELESSDSAVRKKKLCEITEEWWEEGGGTSPLQTRTSTQARKHARNKTNKEAKQAAKQRRKQKQLRKAESRKSAKGSSYLIVATSDDEEDGSCKGVGAGGGETRTVGRGSWIGGAGGRGAGP